MASQTDSPSLPLRVCSLRGDRATQFWHDDIPRSHEGLPHFIKIALRSKKGVRLPVSTFDFDTFEAAAAAGGKRRAQDNGKPWKHRRGAKSIRALKPERTWLRGRLKRRTSLQEESTGQEG